MSKSSRPASYVRLSTRLLCGRAFPCSSSKYRPRASNKNVGVGFRRGTSQYRPRDSNKLDRASPSTMSLFRRRSHAPLTLVAIRACSSPCAALRRSARLPRGCSSSRRENAGTFVSLLVLRNYREAHSFSLRVDTSGQERRTEGIAIVTRSVNRVIPPPRGPRKVPQRSEDTLWGIRSNRATGEPTAAKRRTATNSRGLRRG